MEHVTTVKCASVVIVVKQLQTYAAFFNAILQHIDMHACQWSYCDLSAQTSRQTDRRTDIMA